MKVWLLVFMLGLGFLVEGQDGSRIGNDSLNIKLVDIYRVGGSSSGSNEIIVKLKTVMKDTRSKSPPNFMEFKFAFVNAGNVSEGIGYLKTIIQSKLNSGVFVKTYSESSVDGYGRTRYVSKNDLQFGQGADQVLLTMVIANFERKKSESGKMDWLRKNQ